MDAEACCDLIMIDHRADTRELQPDIPICGVPQRFVQASTCQPRTPLKDGGGHRYKILDEQALQQQVWIESSSRRQRALPRADPPAVAVDVHAGRKVKHGFRSFGQPAADSVESAG